MVSAPSGGCPSAGLDGQPLAAPWQLPLPPHPPPPLLQPLPPLPRAGPAGARKSTGAKACSGCVAPPPAGEPEAPGVPEAPRSGLPPVPSVLRPPWLRSTGSVAFLFSAFAFGTLGKSTKVLLTLTGTSSRAVALLFVGDHVLWSSLLPSPEEPGQAVPGTKEGAPAENVAAAGPAPGRFWLPPRSRAPWWIVARL